MPIPKKDPIENILIDAAALSGSAEAMNDLQKCSPAALKRLSAISRDAKQFKKHLDKAIEWYEKNKKIDGLYTGIVTTSDPRLPVGERYLTDEAGNPLFIIKPAPQYKAKK